MTDTNQCDQCGATLPEDCNCIPYMNTDDGKEDAEFEIRERQGAFTELRNDDNVDCCTVLNETIANLVDLLKAHRKFFMEEGYINDAVQCDEVISNPYNVNAVNAIKADAIEECLKNVPIYSSAAGELSSVELIQKYASELRNKQ